MTTATALRLEGVTVTYRDGDDLLTVLDDLDLAVAPGELVSITGRSGSGKSTLLAVAGMLSRCDRGIVEVDGQRVDGLTNRARTRLRRDRVSIIHQSPQLFPSLTAVEQLELVAHIRGDLGKVSRQRARDLLEEVGIAHRMSHRPSQLSGGERQRLEVARALMTEPAVILADEPTAALDPARAREVMELITTETRQRAIATVVVVHDPDLTHLADRQLELRSGALAPSAAT